MYQFGVFPIHNSFLITLDFLLDLNNSLVMGSSAIEYVKQKLRLLSDCEDISGTIETNLSNYSKDIGRACVALLITPDDLNRATCALCGNCPKIVNRRGLKKYSKIVPPSRLPFSESEIFIESCKQEFP